MADLSTNIPQISFGQADKETAVNELFDAASPSMLFGRNGVTSAGLNFGIFGGRWNGVAVANKVLALTDNSTLYISASLSTGDATFQTGSFKTGEMPLYKVTTSGGLVTAYEDRRAAYGIGIPEAPNDGKQYARKDAGWAEVATSYGDMEAATYDPQGIEADAFDRANHTGTQLMASISDKQGKVLDDLTHLPSDTDLDTLFDLGGYMLDADELATYQMGTVVFVYETEHPVYGAVIAQQCINLIQGSVYTRWHSTAAGGWQPVTYGVTEASVKNWYNATTADPPNAVINSDGSFSRSINSFVPEAPTDGKTYGRKDTDWVEIAGGGGGAADWNTLANKPAVIGAGSSLAGAQAALGIVVSATAPTSPAEGTIWIKVV